MTLQEVLEFAKENGYKAYKASEIYGYLITPSDNVLYVQEGMYDEKCWFRFDYGIHMNFSCKPNRKCGSGVSIMNTSNTITLVDLETAEADGIHQMYKYGSQFMWKSSEEWREKYWDRYNLKEM